MSHEVFISYSSMDKEVADLVCAALERSGTGAWIAPRDVMPGKPYGEALIDAINDSKVMVLVLSGHSNHSSQVVREVERAASKGIPIIPFRIADVRLAKSLEYFLSTCHWLDAFGGTVDHHIPRLTEAVNATLRAVYEGDTLPLEGPIASDGKTRPKPAAPKKNSREAVVLAQAVDESVCMAEVVGSPTQRAQQPSAENPYAPSQHHAAQPTRHDGPRNRGGNSLGVAGLTTSIIGLLTCGTFSPIGLLLSMIGLRKAPRGNAIAGSLLGAAGTFLFAVLFTFGLFSGFTTAVEMEDAAAQIDGYYYTYGEYPSEYEGAEILAYETDAWNQPLRYQRTWPDGYEIRSAGLDGAFDTADDHALVR